MVFNGIANTFYKTAYQRDRDCLSHDTYPDAVDLPIGNANTAKDLFAAVRDATNVEGPLALELDRDLVVALEDGPWANNKRS